MNDLVRTFGSEARWLNWRYEDIVDRDGNKKRTKVPVYYDKLWRKASTADQKTWRDYESARKFSPNVGFVFLPDKTTLGVDLDGCLLEGAIVHPDKEKYERFLKAAYSYTEISPSGTGLHVILKIEEPLSLESNKQPRKGMPAGLKPVELYSSGRFFTVTEKVFGSYSLVRTVSAKECETILAILGYPWKEKTEVSKVRANLPDDRLDLMFKSKSGEEIKRLYEGDTSSYGNDYSSAEMAFACHLAFWTGKNPAEMERIWLTSPLGQRSKTAKRKDYRELTIRKAIELTKTAYGEGVLSPFVRQPDGNEVILALDGKGKPICNMSNMAKILKGHEIWKDRLKYNDWTKTLELDGRPYSDSDTQDIVTFLEIVSSMRSASSTLAYDAALYVGMKNRYDEAKDWLESLVWDGIPRLHEWLQNATRSKDSDGYLSYVGQVWFTAMARRVYHPGSPFDHILMLVGPQGMGKTSLLKIVAGEKWYGTYSGSLENKEVYMAMPGKLVIDWDEGSTIYRSDVIKAKGFISATHDTYRMPYGRVMETHPRRFVFALTTNDPQLLRDEANRRYLAVDVKHPVDFAWLRDNRDQLFAEAVHRVKSETKAPIISNEVILEHQEAYELGDSWEDTVMRWAQGKASYCEGDRNFSTTVEEVWKEAFNDSNKPRPPTERDERRIEKILRKTLGMENRQVRVKSQKVRRYFLTDKKADELYKNPLDYIPKPKKSVWQEDGTSY